MNSIRIETIKRLLRRDALTHLRKIVNKTHAADISVIFPFLSLSNQHKLFDMIADTQQRESFSANWARIRF